MPLNPILLKAARESFAKRAFVPAQAQAQQQPPGGPQGAPPGAGGAAPPPGMDPAAAQGGAGGPPPDPTALPPQMVQNPGAAGGGAPPPTDPAAAQGAAPLAPAPGGGGDPMAGSPAGDIGTIVNQAVQQQLQAAGVQPGQAAGGKGKSSKPDPEAFDRMEKLIGGLYELQGLPLPYNILDRTTDAQGKPKEGHPGHPATPKPAAGAAPAPAK